MYVFIYFNHRSVNPGEKEKGRQFFCQCSWTANPWQMLAQTETEAPWLQGKIQERGADREADIEGKHTNNRANAYLL